LAVRGLDGPAAKAALEAGFAEADRLATLLLAERTASEIDVLNRVPMKIEIELSPPTAAALAEALAMAECSDGAYDPTARAPLRKVWGLESGEPRIPRPFEIDMALRTVDWTDVVIGPAGHSASRRGRRTRIDLGPVALGAVLDGAVAALDTAGARAGLAAAGGIWVAFGAGTDPWPLALDTPSGRPRLRLADGAVATTARGPVHRTADGQTIQEPFDPRSGRPVEEALWSVARAPSAARAGGAAAVLMVLGRGAPEWLADQPDLEGAVVLVDLGRVESPATGLDWGD
jgi:thiamine biosynthesis lipoprotein ApbE